MPKKLVTKNATKQEILDAYEQLQKQIEQGDNQLSPVTLQQASNTIAAIDEDLKSKMQAVADAVKAPIQEIISRLANAQTLIESQATLLNGIQTEAKLQQERMKKEHARQEEEFAYEFDRKKKRLESDLAEKIANAEKQLVTREETLATAEKELVDLRELAASFEVRLTKGIQEAVDRKTKELETAHAQQLKLITQEAKAREDLLKQKVESLEAVIKNQQIELARMSKQVDVLSDQLTKIAQSAVSRTNSGSENKPQL